MPILSHRIRRLLRPIVPSSLRHRILNRISRSDRYRTGTNAEIFGAIYRDGIWGGGDDFMSGGGSRDPSAVDPYVEAIRSFVSTLPEAVDAVDLGCGDFHVGSALVPLFRSYRACDVVPALIERNRKKFVDPRLSFEVVDLVADPLPRAEVAFVRQVLQHLSNDQVMQVLPKLDAYRFVIITEHIPAGDFRPNLDKMAGPDLRLKENSGIALDAPPFSWARHRRTLCRIDSYGSVLETTLWTAAASEGR